MSYDPTVPNRLKHIQEWFGGAITQSMYSDIETASDYITDTPHLSAADRMSLYNQSYWLRLLDTLIEEYPFLSRLFGKEAFNEEIGKGYITAYPPTHWSLNYLGSNLLPYLEKTYQASDAWLVLKAAEIDAACQTSFFAVYKPAINLSSYTEPQADELLDKPLELQSDVHLIECTGQFMLYREAFLQESHEHWIANDFPKLDKENTFYFIVYRNKSLNVSWDTLEPQEYKILKLIEAGHTISDALNIVDAGDEAAFWVQAWLIRGWLTLSTKKRSHT
jgi:hypothetical protein